MHLNAGDAFLVGGLLETVAEVPASDFPEVSLIVLWRSVEAIDRHQIVFAVSERQ